MILSETGLKSIILKNPQKIYSKSKRISEIVIDETLIKVWVRTRMALVATIKPENKQILALSISKEKNMLVAERFISKLVVTCGSHPVSTDGGTWYPPQSCRFLKLPHHIHSLSKKVWLKEQCNT